MRLNRLDLVRVFEKVKSVNVNEILVDENGVFKTSSPDGVTVLQGKGFSFGRAAGFLDIDMMLKMLKKMTEQDIEILIQGSSLKMRDANLLFGYRLAATDVVHTVDDSAIQQFEQMQWVKSDLGIEEALKIVDLCKALGVDNLSFKEEEGKLLCVVGDERMFYGRLHFSKEAVQGMNYKFLAERLLPVLDALDEPKVEFSFSLGERRLMRVKIQDYCWWIGSLLEE